MLAKMHKLFRLYKTTQATTEPPAHATSPFGFYKSSQLQTLWIWLKWKWYCQKGDGGIQATKAFCGTDLGWWWTVKFEFHRQHSNWKLSKSRLHQSESKFGLKVGQSKKKWQIIPLSSLQVTQREPSVSANQGIPPFKPKSDLNMSTGNQVRINIGDSPEHTWRNIFKTSSSCIQIRMTQSIFIPRIFVRFVYFIFYNCFPRRVIRKSWIMKPRFEIVKKFVSVEGLTYTRQYT